MNWERLYSILKMTREEKGNSPIQDESYRKCIKDSISIKDVEKMDAREIKEAIINYLEVTVPELRGKY